MADHFEEISSESGLSRIGSSIKGILFGLFLIAATPFGLYFNEKNAVETAAGLTEGAGKCQSIPDSQVCKGEDPALVHVTGKAVTDETIADPEFPEVKAPAIRLVRKVEMYQWVEHEKKEKRDKLGGGSETKTTYDYKKEWDEDWHDSSKFRHPKDHLNPDMPYKSWSKSAEKVTVGKFTLSTSLIKDIDKATPIPADEALLKTLNAEAQAKFHVGSGCLETGEKGKPVVGDVRVRWEKVDPQMVSIIAGQKDNVFHPWKASNGKEFEMLEEGTVDAKTMFQNAQNMNVIVTWIFRVVGFFCMWIGISCLFGPIVAIARIIPFFGSIVDTGVTLFSFVAASCITLGIIAVAWFVVRPLLSIALIVVALGIAIAIRSMGAKKA
jgi:hypothetical protein